MSSVMRAANPRLLLAAVLMVSALSGCDIFDKKKTPLPGERVSVLGDRRDLEPDSDVAGLQVVLPPPTVNDSWPQSGGFPNNAMHNLAIGDSPQVIWTADVGSGSGSTRILTTPPVVAEGKVFAKDAQGTVSAFNADTGALLWRVSLAPEKARDSDEFGGGLAYYGGGCSSRPGSPWSIRSIRPPARKTGSRPSARRCEARRWCSATGSS